MNGKADDLYKKAFKKANSLIIPFFMDEESIFNEAGELFNQAGHIFKKDKRFSNAIDSYLNAGKCYLEADEQHDAIKSFENAALLYKYIDDSKQAILIYKKVIEICEKNGQFYNAAKTAIQIAKIYEKIGNIKNTINYYTIATNYLDPDNTECSQYILKIADLKSLSANYIDSIEHYEKVAKIYVDNNLLKYQTKKILYKSLLCHLLNNNTISLILLDYNKLDPCFMYSREYRFIDDLHKIYQNYDAEEFQKLLNDYDKISHFDAWDITILKRIKNNIINAQESNTNISLA